MQQKRFKSPYISAGALERGDHAAVEVNLLTSDHKFEDEQGSPIKDFTFIYCRRRSLRMNYFLIYYLYKNLGEKVMRFLLIALFALAGLQANAKTVNGTVQILFNLVQTSEDCLGFGARPEDCPSLYGLNIGETYTGFFSLTTDFTTTDMITWTYEDYDNMSVVFCSLGPATCLGTPVPDDGLGGELISTGLFDIETVSFRPFSNVNYNAIYFWDAIAGTGYHTWEVDNGPYTAVGEILFSDIVIREDFLPAPLPAGGLLLVAGLGALVGLRRLHPAKQC